MAQSSESYDGSYKLPNIKANRWLTLNGSVEGIPQNEIKPIREAVAMARRIVWKGLEMPEDVRDAFETALKGRKTMHRWWRDHQDANDKGEVDEAERHKACMDVLQEVFDILQACPIKAIVKGQEIDEEKTSARITSPAMASNSEVRPDNLQKTPGRMPVMARDVIDHGGWHLVTKDKITQPKCLIPGTNMPVQPEGSKAQIAQGRCSSETLSQSNTVKDTHGESQGALKSLHGEAPQPAADPPTPKGVESERQDDEEFQLVTRDQSTQPKIRFPGITKSSGYTWE
ncbi:MAG: hypothetical protein Q9208_002879 [Pyrenodesmia sp. 3 TL-2023]